MYSLLNSYFKYWILDFKYILLLLLCIISNMADGEAGIGRPDPHSQVFVVLQTL